MAEITLTRADSPEITRRIMGRLARHIEVARGCPFCDAASLLRVVREFIEKSNLCACPGSPARALAAEFEADVRDVLVAAPGPTRCRVCRRLRIDARRFLAYDARPAGAPCYLHAQCLDCAPRPAHSGVH